MAMTGRISFPIPAGILDLTFASAPITIGLFAMIMRFNDYLFSGSFFQAAGITPCCDTFDFIVVGGGSGGSAMAARLSENPKIRVLLLEVGSDPNPLSYIPAAAPNMQQHPETDCEFKTLPQNGSALALKNQEVLFPRGKNLGGSSNINFMIYMRGNPRDYDRWAEHTQDSRWNYVNVEKYFRKMEDYYGHWEDTGYHGKGGPLRVEGYQYLPGINYVIDAAHEIGFEIRDPNQDQKQGFSPLDATIKRGFRFSTFRAYLKPALHRPNLVIYRYTHVTKIHFDENLRAVGVSYFRHGVKGYAQASKEIILSAGSINSPQLLMLSGIGPQEHLIQNRVCLSELSQIQPLVNLPVGQNLQDHVTAVAGPFILNQSLSLILHRDVDVGATFALLKDGTGPLTSALGVMAVGLASTSQNPVKNWPDVMLTVAGLGIFSGLPQTIGNLFNIGNIAEIFLNPDLGKDSHFVLVTLGLPKSRGYVRLRDSNPFSKPIINPQYFSDSDNHDIKSLVEGVEIAIQLYEKTASLGRLGSQLSRSFPGCEHTPFRSQKYIECLVRSLTLTLYHPSCTCSMGQPNDPSAVLNSELKVLGVEGLRVADASVMPFITNANTNAPTIAIAEICADMIKSEWKI